MRPRLGVIVGVGALAVLLVGALTAGTLTSEARDVLQLRQQIDRIRLTAPHSPPELVPPKAPGPGVIA